MIAPLPLKDVHPGAVPAWWPPAPGWWLLLAAVLLALAVAGWWYRRSRRRAQFARLFDDAIAAAATPAEKIGTASELLRRAARRIDPEADRLAGEAWLRFLDAGLAQPVFATGPGALIGDGAFRSDVAPAAAKALCVLARERYLDWMRGA